MESQYFENLEMGLPVILVKNVTYYQYRYKTLNNIILLLKPYSNIIENISYTKSTLISFIIYYQMIICAMYCFLIGNKYLNILYLSQVCYILYTCIHDYRCRVLLQEQLGNKKYNILLFIILEGELGCTVCSVGIEVHTTKYFRNEVLCIC